jgi:hypothetical protein
MPLHRGFPALRLAAFVLTLVLTGTLADARTLRLFVVGNSFSNNATRYLPDLAKEGGHDLILATAMTGGCSFDRHWAAVDAFVANPDDPKAKIYGGKSLHERIGSGPWDVITIQQYSLHSPDYGTYQPSATHLCDHLKKLQPQAEIVIHQTWAYRVDAAKFGLVAPGENAASNREMWDKSRAAYWRLAADLGARVLPVGDAFWQVNSDPVWAYRPDPAFDQKTAQHPALPAQTNSLHVGYRWSPQKKLSLDANHANAAGEYLGALVWYGVLFRESPERLTFAPKGVSAEFAVHLRRAAWQTVQSIAAENAKVTAKPDTL